MSSAVLVVDDDNAIRESVAFCLREEGYTVFEATDGRAALDRLREQAEGMVVLLDLNMPEVDGFAVVQAVELETALAERHAYIVMTAQESRLPVGFVEELTRMNIAVLPKPFDVDKLIATVAAAAERIGGETAGE